MRCGARLLMLIGAVIYRINDETRRFDFNNYIHELIHDTFKVDMPLGYSNFLIIRPSRASGVIIAKSFLDV